jgi:histidinol-phosphate aminotransferase
MKIEQMIRQEVRGFEPYLPGKPIQEVQRELGLKKIVKLASNENAIGTSPKAVKAMRQCAEKSYLYPEGPATILRRALAKKLKVKDTEVVIGAGSDELIEIIGKTFFKPGDEIIVSEHAFIRYKMAGDLMGIQTVAVPMKNDTHDLLQMAAKINRRTKAIFIANPNNPTGTWAGRSVTDQFMGMVTDRIRSMGMEETPPFIIFDEAYYEFAKALAPDYPDTLSYFRQGLNVVVMRTFSKIYGLAGLRVGYAVMRDEAVRAMDRVRPPFNVCVPAQAGAVAALSDGAHVKKSIAVVRSGMKTVKDELNRLGIPYMPSAGNFLLADVSPLKGKEVFQKLLKKGVIVRAMDEYRYPNHVRVTIGKPEENRFFIKNLAEVLKGK